MSIQNRLKQIWHESHIKAYLTKELCVELSLKDRLKLSFHLARIGGVTCFIALSFLTGFYGQDIGILVIWAVVSLGLYCVFVHSLVIARAKDVYKFVINEDHPIDFGKYVHVTKYRKSGDAVLDKYLEKYFAARQFSMFFIIGMTLSTVLMLILLLMVLSGL